MEPRDDRTQTSAFGVGRREGHDASAFYARFAPPALSNDEHVNRPPQLIEQLGDGQIFHGSSTDMHQLPDSSVALVVTSPPYFVGKEYELAVTGEGGQIPGSYLEFLDMLGDVFAECRRVLEPGGRIAVNVANLGRKPYRSLSADVISILQDDLHLLLRGEVIWEKSATSSGSCAWGSFAKASNPVLRDMTERVIIASKGRFNRAISAADRRKRNLPYQSTMTNDEFVDVTRDVWRIDAESASRIGHPAPFPVDLPRRLIDLYTYRGDIVVDPFAGSGSTLVAAARTGRIGVGYDLDPTYVELARQRFDGEVQRVKRRTAQTTNVSPTASVEDRQEHFQARAVDEAKRVHDIARRCLVEAGFHVDDTAKHPSGLVEFDFLATNADGTHQWWVDVAGSFVTTRSGLQRIDAVWRLLGRLHVLGVGQRGVLVLTPQLPKRGTPSDRALRAVGPSVIFDAIELYEPEGLDRLHHYATETIPTPLPGFWSTAEVADGSPG